MDKKIINVYLNFKYIKCEIDKMFEKDKKDKKVNENLGFNLLYEGEIDFEKIVEKLLVYLFNILE